jgi:hypothetical protein
MTRNATRTAHALMHGFIADIESDELSQVTPHAPAGRRAESATMVRSPATEILVPAPEPTCTVMPGARAEPQGIRAARSRTRTDLHGYAGCAG